MGSKGNLYLAVNLVVLASVPTAKNGFNLMPGLALSLSIT
jgi:hypothetical protein